MDRQLGDLKSGRVDLSKRSSREEARRPIFENFASEANVVAVWGWEYMLMQFV